MSKADGGPVLGWITAEVYESGNVHGTAPRWIKRIANEKGWPNDEPVVLLPITEQDGEVNVGGLEEWMADPLDDLAVVGRTAGDEFHAAQCETIKAAIQRILDTAKGGG